LIHILNNGRFVKCFNPPLEKNEKITFLKMHNNGEILLSTSQNTTQNIQNKVLFYK